MTSDAAGCGEYAERAALIVVLCHLIARRPFPTRTTLGLSDRLALNAQVRGEKRDGAYNHD
jgi:hypothetical protein